MSTIRICIFFILVVYGPLIIDFSVLSGDYIQRKVVNKYIPVGKIAKRQSKGVCFC